MNRHAYWTALSFIASGLVAGAVVGATYVGLGDWLHDRFCYCDIGDLDGE